MANIYRVRAASSGWVGAPGLNTFYFKSGAGALAGDNPTAVLCVDRVRAAFVAGAGLYPTSWSVQVDSQVDVIADDTGSLVSSQDGGSTLPVAGASSGGYGAIPAMHLLRFITATVINGRRLRGRAFFGPTAAALDTDGSPAVVGLNLVRAMGAQLLSPGLTGPPLVVWHRPFAGDATAVPPRPAYAGSSAIVTGYIAPDKFAVLRSRRD